jgi:hypothetical protein
MAIVVLENERSEKDLRKVEEERDRIIGRDRVEVGMTSRGYSAKPFLRSFRYSQAACVSRLSQV